MEKLSALAEGTLLQGGKYRIVRFIGAGGFGCTYEAVFELVGAKVAIKEFFPNELCNRDATGRMSVGTDSQKEFLGKMRKKFVDEASRLFGFNGMEGVVKVTDVFEENGTSYFVMDFIDGQNLHSLIKQHGPLPEAEALRIIREAGQALKRVHDRGCLHLDIKPDNIMLANDGHPVLIDFGVSKQYSAGDGCSPSTLVGCTPGYAPLEQLNADIETFTPATDVYALGATLYALVAGNKPPSAAKILNGDADLSFPPGVSFSTRYAIESAMQTKVKDRPYSVDAFLAMLPGGEPQRTGANVTELVKAKPRPRRKLLVAAAAAIALAIAAVMIWRVNVGASSYAPMDIDTMAVEELVCEGVPPSSAELETVMIFAYAGEGGFREYTMSDWDGFYPQQRARVTPVGVLLTTDAGQFIVAPTDAEGGKDIKWEEANSYENCVGIPNLKDIPWDEGKGKSLAEMDYNGKINSDAILSFGKKYDKKYPALEEAKDYNHKLDWYLPACGQMWLIWENKAAVDEAIEKIDGKAMSKYLYWTSTQSNNLSAWVVGLSAGALGTRYKSGPNKVRPVADIPHAQE